MDHVNHIRQLLVIYFVVLLHWIASAQLSSEQGARFRAHLTAFHSPAHAERGIELGGLEDLAELVEEDLHGGSSLHPDIH